MELTEHVVHDWELRMQSVETGAELSGNCDAMQDKGLLREKKSREEVLTLDGENKAEQRGVARLIPWLALYAPGFAFFGGSRTNKGNIFNEVL